jgi:hypothetical protein
LDGSQKNNAANSIDDFGEHFFPQKASCLAQQAKLRLIIVDFDKAHPFGGILA